MAIKTNRRDDTLMVPMAIYGYYIGSVAPVLPIAFMTFSAQVRAFYF